MYTRINYKEVKKNAKIRQTQDDHTDYTLAYTTPTDRADSAHDPTQPSYKAEFTTIIHGSNQPNNPLYARWQAQIFIHNPCHLLDNAGSVESYQSTEHNPSVHTTFYDALCFALQHIRDHNNYLYQMQQTHNASAALRLEEIDNAPNVMRSMGVTFIEPEPNHTPPTQDHTHENSPAATKTPSPSSPPTMAEY